VSPETAQWVHSMSFSGAIASIFLFFVFYLWACIDENRKRDRVLIGYLMGLTFFSSVVGILVYAVSGLHL